ncbi:transglycosylase SLT domain-containing protein [Kribbella sp. DT2]
MWVNKGWWLIVVGAVGVAACVARGPESSDGDAKAGTPASTATQPSAKPSAKPTATSTDWWTDYDPAHFAVQVRKSAAAAKVNPQLLMAILYNESYKPHDPEFERSWQKIDSNPALGIANMHEAAFEDTQRGRRMPGRTWNELPDHPELAIEAAAWHLSDLAKGLPARPRAKLTKDELVALGYNAGRGNMRLFANGRKPGSQAQSYLDRLHDNWQKSADAVKM